MPGMVIALLVVIALLALLMGATLLFLLWCESEDESEE